MNYEEKRTVQFEEEYWKHLQTMCCQTTSNKTQCTVEITSNQWLSQLIVGSVTDEVSLWMKSRPWNQIIWRWCFRCFSSILQSNLVHTRSNNDFEFGWLCAWPCTRSIITRRRKMRRVIAEGRMCRTRRKNACDSIDRTTTNDRKRIWNLKFRNGGLIAFMENEMCDCAAQHKQAEERALLS